MGYITLDIWDAKGENLIRSQIYDQYKDIDVVIVMFDVDEYQTFESMQEWLHGFREQYKDDKSEHVD